MFNKTKVALAAIIVFGAASAALAGSKDDAEWGHDRYESVAQSRTQTTSRTDNAGFALGLGSPTQTHKRKPAK